VIKETELGDCQDFDFTRDFGANFLLDDDEGVPECVDTNRPQSVTFDDLTAADYLVTETVPDGWVDLTNDSITCLIGADPADVTEVAPGVTIHLGVGEDVVCTFFNSKGGDNTRTQGFWKTHTTFTQYVFDNLAGGEITIGSSTKVIDDYAKLFGAWYSSIPKESDKSPRSSLDQARMQLVHQLLTAKLNCAAFDCSAGIQNAIDLADERFNADSISDILESAGVLGTYNESGETDIEPPLPVPGKATPKVSQGLATADSKAGIVFWDDLPGPIP